MVVIPFFLPICGEQVFAVGEDGGLLRHGHPVVKVEPVRFELIYVHHRLRDRINVELFGGEGQDMPALRIPHEHIVRLIQNVGSVPVGAVLFEVDVLIHVGVHRLHVVFGVPLVEGIQNFLKMPRLHRHLIVEDTDDGILFDVAFKLCHEFFIGERAAARAFPARRKRCGGERCGKAQCKYFSAFHTVSSRSRMR